MSNLKLLNSLSEADLQLHACWKHYYVEDREYIQSFERIEISENDEDDYIVSTKFILNDGSEFLGFCSPKDTSGLDYTQPTIVTSEGHLPFYFDSQLNIELADLELLAKKIIKKNIGDIFPLKLISNVKCDGLFYEDEIEAFSY